MSQLKCISTEFMILVKRNFQNTCCTTMLPGDIHIFTSCNLWSFYLIRIHGFFIPLRSRFQFLTIGTATDVVGFTITKFTVVARTIGYTPVVIFTTLFPSKEKTFSPASYDDEKRRRIIFIDSKFKLRYKVNFSAAVRRSDFTSQTHLAI